MVLHFNLKFTLALCCLLMLCHLFFADVLVFSVATLVIAGWCYFVKTPTFADGIFAIAFLMNLWYVLASWGNVRQYDYYNFVMHADYFLKNDLFIEKPMEYLGMIFFQPPLWGLIIAIVTKVCMLLGASQEFGFDSVRFISLFCILGTVIIFWRLIDEFDIKGKVKYWLFALYSFFPIHGIVANLVNNDAMIYFLMMMTLYYAYGWYLEGKWQQAFIISGLLIGAGMVKFSGLMMLPAVGVFGCFRFLQEEKKFDWQVLGQLGVIGCGAILGFAWGLFLLYYNMPLVPPPIDNGFQDLRTYGVADRLLSLEYVGEVFADVRMGTLEPNVWLALVKTSLFGEWSWQGVFWAYIMYVLGVVFALIAVISFSSILVYRFKGGWGVNASFIVLVFSVLGAWINFWMMYPYFCSSEYRYVMILLPIALLWIGNFMTQKSLPKAVYYTMAGGITLFIFARFMLYLNTI